MSKYNLSEQIILKQLQKLSQPTTPMIPQDREEEDVVDQSPLLALHQESKKKQKQAILDYNLTYLAKTQDDRGIKRGMKKVVSARAPREKVEEVEEGERILGPGFLKRYPKQEDESEKKKRKEKEKRRNKKKRKDEADESSSKKRRF